MNKVFVAAIGAVIAIVAGVFFLSQSNTPPDPFGAAFAQDADVDTSIVVEMSLGNPDAAVTMTEYASFTCPHCARFHAETFKTLKADYIDTGKIHFIYREVYFDRYGLWAGIVARCGGDERYFGIADLIYTQQREWTQGDDPATIAANLRKIGKTAGLTDAELDTCMTDAEMAKAMFAFWQQNQERDEINSTPSFLINGEKYSNMEYSEFQAILDKALADG